MVHILLSLLTFNVLCSQQSQINMNMEGQEYLFYKETCLYMS